VAGWAAAVTVAAMGVVVREEVKAAAAMVVVGLVAASAEGASGVVDLAEAKAVEG
jgi:hypothetical protein